MKRRSFLVGSAAAALTTWPAWLARAFEPQASCDASARLEQLFDGYRAARRAGKPLLVLIIPASDQDKWTRGTLFGQVLNFGDEQTLAALSQVTLGCATREELGRLVALDDSDRQGDDAGQRAGQRDDKEEPWFATIDTTLRPARVRSYPLQPPPMPERADWSSDTGDVEAQEQRAIDERIEALGAALREAIGDATAASKLDPSDAVAGELIARRILDREQVAGGDVLRRARALHERAQGSTTERSQLIAALAAAVRSEVVSKPVSGSQWGLASGCGTMIEGIPEDQQVRFGCGMGHVPARSERFLYFFTRPSSEDQ